MKNTALPDTRFPHYFKLRNSPTPRNARRIKNSINAVKLARYLAIINSDCVRRGLRIPYRRLEKVTITRDFELPLRFVSLTIRVTRIFDVMIRIFRRRVITSGNIAAILTTGAKSRPGCYAKRKEKVTHADGKYRSLVDAGWLPPPCGLAVPTAPPPVSSLRPFRSNDRTSAPSVARSLSFER